MNKYLLTLSAFAMAVSANAQQKPLTAKDYERAESFMAASTSPYIDRAGVYPNWLPGDKFWYSVKTPQGTEFILVDPAKKSRSAAFDHQKLASVLSTATGNTYDPAKLPFQNLSYSEDGKTVSFFADGKRWKYDMQAGQVTPDADKPEPIAQPSGRRRGGGLEVLSPDGKKAAFIKNYNLWVRDVASGTQTQLTTDGVKDYGYATDNAGWNSSEGPILRWSPDSKKISTFQQDQRKS